jgi:methyl-accepting chemotaxis protein
MRRKLTVGQQIASGYIAVIVIMTLLSVLGVTANTRFKEANHLIAHTYQVLAGLEDILSHLRNAESGNRGFVITGKESFLEPVRQAESAIPQDLERLNRLIADNPEQQRRLAELRPVLTARMELLKVVRTARREQGFEAAQQIILAGEGEKLMEQLRAKMNEMRVVEEQLLQQRDRVAREDSLFLQRLSEVGLAILFIVIISTSIYITRGLRRQIGMAIERVQSSSTELQAAATQQASGAREQASTTTEVATTVKELLSTFRHIAAHAQQVSKAADETAAATSQGSQTVDQSQEAIETVRRQVDVIVSHMLDLGKRSQEIGGILDIINELSEQTNILAINATIESAGAGEHGRRFAVVAEEIRKLADRVGASTKDVRNLIDEIRAAANTTIMATEDGSKAVQHSARRFAEVAGTFKRIAELTNANLDVARQIELSTQQQTSAVEQVSAAIQQVAITAKQTEVSSTQTLQTSTHLIQLSRQLATLVDARSSELR